MDESQKTACQMKEDTKDCMWLCFVESFQKNKTIMAVSEAQVGEAWVGTGVALVLSQIPVIINTVR